MRPPARLTRSNNNPGVIDLPKTRRSSADVSAGKQQSKKTAAANAKKKNERIAQVARVEEEIRVAQNEAAQSSAQGQKKRVKRTFPRETPARDPAEEAALLERAMAVSEYPRPALKRKADMMQLLDEWDRTESAKVAKITLLKEPLSADKAVTDKPHGLAKRGHHSPMINTVIEDFEYCDEGDRTQSDEDGEDDLEYPGGQLESLVAIESTTATDVPDQATRNPRPGVLSLPPNVRRTFSEEFIPSVLEEVGCSATPWTNLDVKLIQGYTNSVYPGLDYVVEKGDPLDVSANARIMSFRSAIGTAALINIKAFLEKFKTPELVEGYVKSGLIYHGEIPFLYRVFEPLAVRSSTERGKYKVTRQGVFQNQAILDTMLVYYGKRGIKEYLPTTSSPGKNPVGVLALICTAIERSLLMHSTGYYIKDERPFSEKFWGHRTAIYIKLAKELSDSRWDGFYAALAYTEGFHEKQSEFSKPVQRWTDDPDEYFIAGSDPADAE